MLTFTIGLLILFCGYIFYSKYVVKQFMPDERQTPAYTNGDGIDYLPLAKNRNALIQLLNIAGMGPIIGAVQGILFGPVAFILIPLGCVLMGGVHDYFSGMISLRNQGLQITSLIKKYLGENFFRFFIVTVSIMLILLASVFVYTSGDLIAERFFAQTDFGINNPVIVSIYILIAVYYILATMFPIDKIIGRFYPYLAGLLLIGTTLIFVGFFINGIQLTELDFNHLNTHYEKLPLIPMFFMTVSCGLLSGFHATQSTIVSRTLSSEFDGRRVFYGMMCVESLIAMIWAAGAMHVYSLNLASQNIIGTANVVNVIADVFVPLGLTFIVTLAVVVLPITSGDTALRGLRMIIADAFCLPQKKIINRLYIIIPLSAIMLGIILWAKLNKDSFGFIWQYFTFFNQLIAIPVFMFSTIFLYKQKKNWFITLLPAIFYVFITSAFILNSKIGFNLSVEDSRAIAAFIAVFFTIWFVKFIKK